MLAHTHFQSLLAKELITEEQYQMALAQYDASDKSEVQDEVGALFWLVSHAVIRESELEAQMNLLASLPKDKTEVTEKIEIVSQVLDLIDDFIQEYISERLDALLALELINAEQHQAGCVIRPTVAEGVIETPASALALLVNRGIVTEDQFNDLKAKVLETPDFAGSRERYEIVTEADKIFHEIVGKYVNAMTKGTLLTFLMLMTPLILLIVGLFLWWK